MKYFAEYAGSLIFLLGGVCLYVQYQPEKNTGFHPELH